MGTPGYWKNHFEAWPVDEICFEDSSGWGICTNAESILERINKPVKGNKCITLLKALVAAKLNVASGCLDICIEETIAYADDWYLDNCGNDDPVKASSRAWYYAEPLYYELDDYNNGKLCAPARD